MADEKKAHLTAEEMEEALKVVREWYSVWEREPNKHQLVARALLQRDEEVKRADVAEKDRDRLDHEVVELKAEVEDHRRSLFVPGLTVCVVCGYEHQQLGLRAADGAVLVSYEPKPLTECPNGCGWLVVVTWQRRAEEAIARVLTLSAEVERLRARLKEQEHREQIETCECRDCLRGAVILEKGRAERVEARLKEVEAENERLLYTSDKQTVAWKDRALAAESRLAEVVKERDAAKADADETMLVIACGKRRGEPCSTPQDVCWEHHAWALEDRLDAANRVIDHQTDVLKAVHSRLSELQAEKGSGITPHPFESDCRGSCDRCVKDKDDPVHAPPAPPDKAQEEARRAIENGECAAQLEVLDAELRESLIRNVAAAIRSAHSRGFSEGEKAGIERAAKVLENHRMCGCHRAPMSPGVVGQEHWGDCPARLYDAIRALSRPDDEGGKA